MSEWNGLPDQPERSGWHWVKAHWNLSPRPYYWLSKDQVWYTEYGCQPPEEIISLKYSYFFPCPDPSELAQMRKDERERCADVFDWQVRDFIECMKDMTANLDSLQRAHDEAVLNATKIRALIDDEGKKS
ncbi:hypothetical protein [Komagataeibacter oboediens]|uniref:hypothetical protein n=1 Tax=Komagataeibacter oboediens TaxID=65958 RepID=UPI0006798991|nr:hypothetical protein [Komagataeibacter oboediens]